MKVLIACEYSGAVREQFLRGGMRFYPATYSLPMWRVRTTWATCLM